MALANVFSNERVLIGVCCVVCDATQAGQSSLVSSLFSDKYCLPIVEFSSNIYILFMIYFEATKQPADRHLDLLF